MTEFTLDVHLDGRGVLDSIGDDVRRGLSAPEKYLYPKYLYDATGSLIFEQITELPEYYPTRTELAILCAQGAEILRRAAPPRAAGAGLRRFHQGLHLTGRPPKRGHPRALRGPST